MKTAVWVVLVALMLAPIGSLSQTPKAQKKYDEAMRDIDYIRPGMPPPVRYRIQMKVEKLLREATEESPDWAAAHAQLGIARMYLQQLKPALEAFERMAELDKANQSLDRELRRQGMSMYGEALARNRQFEKAIELFETVMKDDPGYGGYEYNLACVYSEQGKLEKALPHLKKAWELRSSFDFPDPRKDSSFRQWLDDPRFEEAVRNMVI